MSKINIEIDEKYKEALDILKQVIPDEKGEVIKNDGKMLETLIDSFMAFVQEQANNHAHGDEEGCCGGGGHNKGKGGGCGCSH